MHIQTSENDVSMKTVLITSIAFITLTTVITTVAMYLNKKRKLEKISEEGYETAIDIIAPESSFRKLHYGPVIPA